MDPTLAQLVRDLDAALEARGMGEHRQLLWEFRRGKGSWSETHVRHLARCLGVGPEPYPLLPVGARCPTCAPGEGQHEQQLAARTVQTWPGGWLLECGRRHGRWRVEEAPQ